MINIFYNRDEDNKRTQVTDMLVFSVNMSHNC